MTSKKTLKHMMIDRNGKTVYTRPEQNFNAYQESRGLGLVWNKSLPFSEDGQPLIFQCDFLRPTDTTFDIDFEVDGSHYHSSNRQMAKDRWKDHIKNAHGLKVVHIPAVLTERFWWDYLDRNLPLALASPDPVVHLIA